jgi:hypothetical protein
MEDASLDDFVDPGRDGDAAGDRTTDSRGADEETTTEESGDGARGTDRSGEAGSEDGRETEPGASGSSAEPPVDPGAVTPATPTVRWSPAGEPCASCDETVERRWQSEAGPVCGDCVDW